MEIRIGLGVGRARIVVVRELYQDKVEASRLSGVHARREGGQIHRGRIASTFCAERVGTTWSTLSPSLTTPQQHLQQSCK